MGAIQALVQPCQLVRVALAGRGTQRARDTPEVVDDWGCLAASAAVAAARARLQFDQSDSTCRSSTARINERVVLSSEAGLHAALSMYQHVSCDCFNSEMQPCAAYMLYTRYANQPTGQLWYASSR
jgi:hypothetical protein